MRTRAQQAGDDAEAQVAAHLAGQGWHVLATHFRVGRGEVDILAVDLGPPPSLVAVEVRWRGRRDYGLPEETVDQRKRAQLRRAGYALRELGHLPDGTQLPNLPLRFDLVVLEPNRPLRHHRYGA